MLYFWDLKRVWNYRGEAIEALTCSAIPAKVTNLRQNQHDLTGEFQAQWP